MESGFKVKNSIIFEVESGFDDICGQDIRTKMFGGGQVTYDYSSIDEVEGKIIEIIKDINCKYKINYID